MGRAHVTKQWVFIGEVRQDRYQADTLELDPSAPPLYFFLLFTCYLLSIPDL